jgi:hypothetical protein
MFNAQTVGLDCEQRTMKRRKKTIGEIEKRQKTKGLKQWHT